MYSPPRVTHDKSVSGSFARIFYPPLISGGIGASGGGGRGTVGTDEKDAPANVQPTEEPPADKSAVFDSVARVRYVARRTVDWN